MIVYKVVRVIANYRRVSAWAQPPYRLWYKIGVVTKPKIGKCFAFDTLENAKGYVNRNGGDEIWVAEASEATPLQIMTALVEHWEAFWRGEYIAPTLADEGTVACPELTLVRRVKKW